MQTETAPHRPGIQQFENQTLRLNNGRVLGYAEYGDPDGVPVLALHGTPGSRLMIRPAHTAAKARHVRLIAPDRPGYGLSDPSPGYSFARWVKDATALLDHLNIERCLLFGVSGGGPYAVALASLAPERVKAVALVSPVGPFGKEVRKDWLLRHRLFFSALPHIPFLMQLVFPPLRRLVLHAPGLPMMLFIRSLGAADREILANPQHVDDLVAAFQDGFRSGSEGVVADLRLFANAWNLPLERAVMPVLVWQGMADLMVPPRAALQLSDRFANAETHCLETAGHFWILDHIDEVLQCLLSRAGSA